MYIYVYLCIFMYIYVFQFFNIDSINYSKRIIYEWKLFSLYVSIASSYDALASIAIPIYFSFS